MRATSVNPSGPALTSAISPRSDSTDILLGQEDHLAVAVPAALPAALAGLDVDCRKDAAVEPVRVPLVDDEVVEVRLQPARCPALVHGPAVCASGDGQAPHPLTRASNGYTHGGRPSKRMKPASSAASWMGRRASSSSSI
jgi:hypothetical protein